VFPQEVEAGVEFDSLLKRVVFRFKSGSLLDTVFSDLVSDDTRVHYFRSPLERVEKIAPFLYLDSDPFAVAADGRVVWMVNGMTTTDRYPYSAAGEPRSRARRSKRSSLRRADGGPGLARPAAPSTSRLHAGRSARRSLGQGRWAVEPVRSSASLIRLRSLVAATGA